MEQQLAKVLGVEPAAVRNYMYSVIEERLWRGRDLTQRRTGFRWVRGTHGGRFVRDPDGTDVLPPGYEAPPQQKVA
jgi:hypothetical protein